MGWYCWGVRRTFAIPSGALLAATACAWLGACEAPRLVWLDGGATRDAALDARRDRMDALGDTPVAAVLPDARSDVPLPARNLPPIASITTTGRYRGALATATGLGSYDPEGAALTYAWRLVDRPTGSAASLASTTWDETRFVPDLVGTYIVELVVRDELQASLPATAEISIEPTPPPTAVPGPDTIVTVGAAAGLDGLGSWDTAGAPITRFSWTVLVAPAGSAVTPVAPSSAQTLFWPDAAGTYELALVVESVHGASAPSTMRITAVAAAPRTDDVAAGLLDPAEVYLVGTLSEGSCGRDALAHPSRPDVAVVGFDCYFDSRSARITDARVLVYENTFEDVVREFECDGCPAWTPPDPYPAVPLANDPIVRTRPCIRVQTFLVSPGSELLYRCEDFAWYRDESTPVALPDRTYPVRYGRAGSVLLDAGYRTLEVFDLGAGTGIRVTTPDCERRAVRALEPSGFGIVFSCGSSDASWLELWTVGDDGDLALVGRYPPPPGGYRDGAEALAADGALLHITRGPDFDDAVVRRTIGGVSEVVYSESTLPPVRLHISGLVTGP